MPEIVPVLIAEGYSAATAAAVYSGLQAAALAAASAAASAAIAKRQEVRAQRQQRNQFNAGLRDQTITLKGGVNPRPVIYGRTAIGGQLLYAESVGTKKEHLLMVVGLAHGEVDAIETIYFNEVALSLDGANQVVTPPYYIPAGGDTRSEQVTVPGGAPYQVTLAAVPATGVQRIQDGFYGWGGGDGGAPPLLVAGTDYTVAGAVITFNSAFANHPVQVVYDGSYSAQSYAAIWRYTGAPGQDISSLMATLGAPSWTAADKCQGMALLVVRLTFAENIWQNGIPNIKAIVRGRKVYDPRSATTVYSNNAALCARDYLTLTNGVNASTAKIDDTATIAAANICDELVQLFTVADTAADRYPSDKRYQYRYAVNGMLSTGDDRRSNLLEIAGAMAGSINYSAGKWRIRAGAYTAPALTLDESRLSASGGIQVVPFASRRDLVNSAKGTYLNEAGGFIEDQFPEWSNATFVTEDGGAKLFTSLPMRMVIDSARAQRLAKVAIYRAREALTLAVTCNLGTYAWQVGDMVAVTLTRYGFSAKPFRILERGFSAEGGVRFVLREEPNGIYDWNLGEASILTGAGNTTLPNPTVVGVPTITGVTSAQWLYKAADGTFVARIRVAVTPPNDQYVQQGGKLQLQYKRGDWSGDWTLVEADGNATAIWIDPAFDSQNYVIRVRAKNSAQFVSAWSSPQFHTCQGRPGQLVNLLQNSDFDQDIGNSAVFLTDARALRYWAASTTGGTWLFLRNYDGGKTYNLGKGGACIYDPSNTVSAYGYLYQDVPVLVGQEYECSVSVSVHRANVILYIRYVDATGATLADFTDSFNSGSAVVGGPYSTADHKRLWTKGTAPTGTIAARVILLCQGTALSTPYPFTAWSRTLLCSAPSGVTRETASNWVPSVGGLLPPTITNGTSSTAYTSGSKGSFAISGPATTATFAGRASTTQVFSLSSGDRLDIEVDYYGPLNYYPGTNYALVACDVVDNSSGAVPYRVTGTPKSGNARYIETPWTSSRDGDVFYGRLNHTYTAPAAQTVTVYANGGSHGGDDTASRTSVVELRVKITKANP